MMKYLTLLLLVVFGLASAHAYLETSSPASGSTLEAAPEQVALTFSEPLEVRFSTFKLTPLKTDATEPREVALAAKDLMEASLGMENEAQLTVNVLTPERESQTATLGLPKLTPGTYVLMWRALSTDTHISEDFMTFKVVTQN